MIQVHPLSKWLFEKKNRKHFWRQPSHQPEQEQHNRNEPLVAPQLKQEASLGNCQTWGTPCASPKEHALN